MRFQIITGNILLIILLSMLGLSKINAQDKALYITYGRQSLPSFGDDNYKQAIFIKIPASAPDKFYVRIFDADCYGLVDNEFTVYNTETIFSLFGVNKILPDGNTIKFNPDKIERPSGEMLERTLYSDQYELDNKWITFAEVNKNDGELLNGYYYFKLLVEGGYGTDGNIFDLYISSESESNKEIPNSGLFSYAPTLRNGKLNRLAQIKFYNKDNDAFTVQGFDMDGCVFNYDTPYRSGIKLNSKGDGLFADSKIILTPEEKDCLIGINFGVYKDVINDISISVLDENSNLVPLQLPVYYKKNNNKPVPKQKILSSEIWNIKIFDASLSRDSDGDRMTYKWSFGDSSFAEGERTQHTFSSSGIFNCSLTATDNSGSIANSSTINFMVKVNQPPVANAGEDIFASSSEIDFDASASIDPDGEIIDYSWDFGDGTRGTGIKPKHVYSLPGNYTVKLQVTDNSQLDNNTNSAAVNVSINNKPIADAGPDVITEPGKDIKFNGLNSIDQDGKIISYKWDFGDGTTSEGAEVIHNYQIPGNYTVTLEVTDSTNTTSAEDIDDLIVIVNSPPFADAGDDILAAPYQEIIFDAARSADRDGNKLNFLWEFSDGKNKSESKIVKRSFDNPGLYKAVLTVTDNSGALNNKSADEINIRINSAPKAIPGNDILTCEPELQFDASSSFDSDGDMLRYFWNFGDGSPIVEGIKVSHEYKTKGYFPVVLTVDDGTRLSNSKTSASLTVVINQAPIADAGEDIVICSGEFVPFDGGQSYDPENGLLKYYWDFGDSTTAIGINPVKSYTKGGVYQVKLTVEDDSGLECNKDIDTKLITVIESPVANAGEDQEVCAFEEVQFDGTKSTDADGVVNSYTWDFGDGSTGGGAMPKHTYTKAGIYKVALSITGEIQGDCDNSSADEMTVVVNEAPVADFSIPSSAPVNTIIKYDASASSAKANEIVSYNWDFGDSTKGTGKVAEHTYENPGQYFITLNVTANSNTECNSSSIINSIFINAAPVAKASSAERVLVNNSIIFDALDSYDVDGAITNYKWDFGDGTSAEGIYAEHIYNSTGNYKVKLTVKDNTDLPNNMSTDFNSVDVYSDYSIDLKSIDAACLGEEINFNSIISPSLPDSLVEYSWEFSDGYSSTGNSISHSFMRSGNYNVTLIAESDLFSVSSKKIVSKSITINSRPISNVQKLIYACRNAEVILDASNSSDPDGGELSFKWDYNEIQKFGSKVSFIFGEPGEHLVNLTIQDDSNSECGSVETNIKVIVNSSPVIVTEGMVQGFTGGAYDAVLFDASESYDDDGDALTYEWDFGDGKKGFGARVYHNYEKPGEYKATLKIKDGRNLSCSSAVKQVNVKIISH